MIGIERLSHSWGDFGLRDVSLCVQPGEYFVILGPCGSGKTLLLEAVAGLYTPTAGRILINGRDVTRLPPERRRVGLVYQQYALFPHLSVRENIAYGLRYLPLTRAEREARVAQMLDLLGIHGLATRQRPAGLSGGEAQKVALARALAVEPEVLLLDEPLSSLDQRARENVLDVLPELSARLEIPVIHVTHDYGEAVSVGDRMAVMRDGAVAQVGSIEDVFRRPDNRFVAEFLGVENILDGVAGPRQGDETQVRVGGLVVTARSRRGAEGKVSLCVRPEDVRLHTTQSGRENTFPARLTDIHDHGFHVRIGVLLQTTRVAVTATRNEFARLGVTVGSDVLVELRPEDVHLMTRTEEDEPHAI